MMEDSFLYKFIPYNKNALLTIFRHELYFASPNKLNDPIDCLHNISLQNINQLKENDILPLIRNYRTHITWNDSLTDFNIAKHHLNENIYLLDLVLKIIRIKTYNKIGVCSFSKIWDDQRLWSHYADSSNGICLVFDYDKLTKKLELNSNRQDSQLRRFFGQEINYDGTPTEIEIFNGDFQISNSYFFKKTKEWQYENEYRLILIADSDMTYYSDYEKNRFYIFPKEALVAIILGEKMSSYDIFTILDIGKPLGYNFQVRQVTRDLKTAKILLRTLN